MAEVEQSQRPDAPADELAALRARLDELQSRLTATEAWANRAVAEAQEKVYWLDRWHLDLNALMERPGADEFRAMIRGLRSVYRFFKRARSGFQA